MLQRTLPAGFIAPCLPTKTDKLPSGSQWLHEIKHDGFRIIARKTGAQVRLYSRPGNDLTRRFPLIVNTLARLSPAMTTALLRSISSVTSALTTASSKRKDSAYRSGRSPDWLKMKNANAPAVKREAEEDWSKERRR